MMRIHTLLLGISIGLFGTFVVLVVRYVVAVLQASWSEEATINEPSMRLTLTRTRGFGVR